MARREVLKIEGVTHGKAPIPLAAKIDNLVFSSALIGKNPATDAVPDSLDEEIRWLFRHVETLMEKAGGSTDDIVKMNVLIRDNSVRETINKYWLEMFPNEDDRPARHITVEALQGKANAQIELVAVLKKS